MPVTTRITSLPVTVDATATEASRRVTLTLYIAGVDHGSEQEALDRLVRAVRPSTEVDYDVEVVDVIARPDRAASASVLACPTLVTEDDGRVRRVVGGRRPEALVRQVQLA